MVDAGFTSFNRGYFSPDMAGRAEFAGALSECLNFIPTVQGPVTRRGGTRYLATAEDGKLFAFVYSSSVSYILLFGDKKIKIWKDRTFNAEIESPYALADVKNGLYLYQQADVVFICHPLHKPGRLIRKGEAQWELNDVEFIDGPFLPNNTTDITLTVSGNNVTASAAVFNENDVGRQIRVARLNGADITWGWAVIDSYTSATGVTVTAKDNWGNGATKIWALGAFSETTGYPSCVAFMEQRLFYGFKSYVFGSMLGASDTFSTTLSDGTVNDDSALFLPLAMEKADGINWMVADSGILVCGTESQTYTVRTTNDGVALTQKTVRAVKDNEQGSNKMKPVAVGNGFVFASQFSKRLMMSSFSYDSYRYQATGLSVFAENLLEKGVLDAAFSREPQPVMWICLKSGGIVGCTLSLENGVAAFSRHDVSGNVVSIAVVPSSTDERDEAYFLANRQIDGKSVFYLEVLEQGLKDDATNTVMAVFADSAVTKEYDSATKEITGLDHLEGATVCVLGDGAVQPDRTVEGGKITIQEPARVVTVGLPYVSVVRPTGISGGNPAAEQRKKKIVSLSVRLFKTVGVKVGGEQIPFGTGERFNQAVSLFTGDKKVPYPDGWRNDANFEISQEQPLPTTVLAVFYNFAAGG